MAVAAVAAVVAVVAMAASLLVSGKRSKPAALT